MPAPTPSRPTNNKPRLLATACGMLLIAFVSAQSVITNAPALRADLRVPGITGASDLPITSEMYHHGRYLFQQGVGFQRASVWAAINGAPRFDPETRAANRGKASSLFENSLRLAPGDASTWQFYAQSYFSQGATDEARAALLVSQALAPHTLKTALQRAALMNTALEDTRFHITLLQEEITSFQSDVRVIQRHLSVEALKSLAALLSAL